jgi:hypothetical protein
VRRVLLIALGLGLAAGGATLAQGQSSRDPYQLPEPNVTSRQVLHLRSDASCVHSRRLTVRFRPPPGAVFGVLSVRTDGHQAVRLTGIPRAASATIGLGPRRTAVSVSGTTLGGQAVRASRSYRRCGAAPKRKAPPRPVPIAGGGEDG